MIIYNYYVEQIVKMQTIYPAKLSNKTNHLMSEAEKVFG